MKPIFCLLLLLLLSPPSIAQRNDNKGGKVISSLSSSNKSDESQSTDEEDVSRLNVQVVQLYQAKKYNEAITLAKKALELSSKKLGEEHKYTIGILNNLAAIYFAKGNNEEAAS